MKRLIPKTLGCTTLFLTHALFAQGKGQEAPKDLPAPPTTERAQEALHPPRECSEPSPLFFCDIFVGFMEPASLGASQVEVLESLGSQLLKVLLTSGPTPEIQETYSPAGEHFFFNPHLFRFKGRPEALPGGHTFESALQALKDNIALFSTEPWWTSSPLGIVLHVFSPLFQENITPKSPASLIEALLKRLTTFLQAFPLHEPTHPPSRLLLPLVTAREPTPPPSEASSLRGQPYKVHAQKGIASQGTQGQRRTSPHHPPQGRGARARGHSDLSGFYSFYATRYPPHYPKSKQP